MENLYSQAQDLTTYWQLYQAQGYLNRLNKNLTITDAPPNAKQITVIGGNLFQLAAQYYGDASQWALIASANNLFDPMLTGTVSLIIPPLNGLDTGGIV